MLSTDAFATTAAEADHRFEMAAGRIRASVERYPCPIPGPDGTPLGCTVARIGPADATAALVVISGIHGVEGFAGGGLQTALLADPTCLGRSADLAVILVHQLNPWGLAWNRREDHDNVDVFRNLLYHEHPATPDPLYDAIDDAIDLPAWGNPNRSDEARQNLVARHGLDRLIAAIRRGQHHRPKGMTYHGQGPCWSTRTIHTIVDRHLAGVRRVAVVDIHTGFGDPGQGLVMSYEPRDSDRYRRARGWIGTDFYTPGGDADIPAHERAPYRFIEDRIPGSEVTAVILEFGTEPPDVTRDLFPLNAYHHLHGDPRSEAARQIGARYRLFCYPETDPWKRAVLARGLTVLTEVTAGLTAWAAEP